jgi:hypothetical protein
LKSGLERREGALRHIAAHGIEHCIAILDGLCEIDGIEVDDFVRPKAAHVFMMGRETNERRRERD